MRGRGTCLKFLPILRGVRNGCVSRSGLENRGVEGETPVDENTATPDGYPK